jgi:hypothetical protein
VDIAGFVGALDFENEVGKPRPEASDSDLNTALRDSDEASDGTDTDSNAPIVQSEDILVDPDSGQELGHSAGAPADDLALWSCSRLALASSQTLPCAHGSGSSGMKRQHGVSRWPR